MEVELKFLVKDKLARDRILQDNYLDELVQEGSREEIQMKAVYFDTESMELCGKKMTFRVRLENGKPVATLKWGENSENGLHIRGELNVHVEENFMNSPNLSVFKGSQIYGELAEIAADKELRPLMEVEYMRKQMMVDTGKSISVVSLDVGEVRTSAGSSDISELEIELYSGDRDDMVEMGRRLASKYNLKESDLSKFQRGLAVIGKENLCD